MRMRAAITYVAVTTAVVLSGTAAQVSKTLGKPGSSRPSRRSSASRKITLKNTTGPMKSWRPGQWRA
jgi:hypothetical protein